MQQKAMKHSDITACLKQLPPTHHAAFLSDLSDPVGEEEVLTAVKRCKRGKAAGPDGLAKKEPAPRTAPGSVHKRFCRRTDSSICFAPKRQLTTSADSMGPASPGEPGPLQPPAAGEEAATPPSHAELSPSGEKHGENPTHAAGSDECTVSPATVGEKDSEQNLSTGSNDVSTTVNKDGTTPVLNFKKAVSPDSSPSSNEEEHAAWVRRLQKIAQRPWKTRQDDNLRPMVPAEAEALAAWAMGALTLADPPLFLACTHTKPQRVVFLEYFETHLEGILVATVPPIVKMPDFVAEKTLLAQFVLAEKKGSNGYETTCKLLRQVKRASYNKETRRVTFVVLDKATAEQWHRQNVMFKGVALRLVSPSKLDEDDLQADVQNAAPRDGETLRYQVRVLAQDMKPSTIEQLFGSSARCPVVSITREHPATSGAYDSNYFLVEFEDERCPETLRDVTHISAGQHSVFLHHFRLHSRVPCFKCYDPGHTSAKCSAAPGVTTTKYHRDFSPKLQMLKPVSELSLKYMTIKERLEYIDVMTKGLVDATAAIHQHGAKHELLVQPVMPTTPALEPVVSDAKTDNETAPGIRPPTIPETVAPSNDDDGWYDPATARKGKGKSGKGNATQQQGAAAVVPPPANATAQTSPTTAAIQIKSPPVPSGQLSKQQQQVGRGQQSQAPSGAKKNSKNKQESAKAKSTKAAAVKKRQEAERALAEALAGNDVATPANEKSVNSKAEEASAVLAAQAAQAAEAKAATEALAVKLQLEADEALQSLKRLVDGAQLAREVHIETAADAHNDALRRESELELQQRKPTPEEEATDRERLQQLIDQLAVLELHRVQADLAVKEAQRKFRAAQSKAKKAKLKIAKQKSQERAPESLQPKLESKNDKDAQVESKQPSRPPPPAKVTSVAERAKQIEDIRAFLQNLLDAKKSTNSQPNGQSTEGTNATPGPAKGEQPDLDACQEGKSQTNEETGRSDQGDDGPAGLDATLHFDDLGAVTPPHKASQLPFPPELQASFEFSNSSQNQPNVPTAGDHPNPAADEQIFTDAAMESVFGTESTPGASLDTAAKAAEAAEIQAKQRLNEDHAATLLQTRRRKDPKPKSASNDTPASNQVVPPVPNVSQEPKEMANMPKVPTKQSSMNSFVSKEDDGTLDLDRQSKANTVASQVEITGVVAGSEPEYYLTSWLDAIGARIVDVPGNGNCLYGAFFVATSGICEFDDMLPYTPEIAKLVQTYKERILWVAQLLVKTEASAGQQRIFMLRARLHQHYPDENWDEVDDIKRISDRLVEHYEEAAKIKVVNKMAERFWGRGAELMAAATYLREPIYVVDVTKDGRLFAQSYAYSEIQAADNESWDVGIECPLYMKTLDQFVSACLKSRVLPTILLNRHATTGNHFQAVRFAEEQYTAYVNCEGEDASPNMRQRLHDVQLAMGLATTDTTLTYDFDPQENGTSKAVRKVSAAASPDRPTSPRGVHFARLEKEADRDAAHLLAEEKVYQRLLSLKDIEKFGSIADRMHHRRLTEVNRRMIKQWQQASLKSQAPVDAATIAKVRDLNIHRAEVWPLLKRLCVHLPYPALAAKSLGIKTLLAWGEAWSMAAQTNYLVRVENDKNVSQAARDLAGAWVQTVIKSQSVAVQWALLNELARWERLGRLIKDPFRGHIPVGASPEQWKLMNVLPYVFWSWRPDSDSQGDVTDDGEDVQIEALVKLYTTNASVSSVLTAILKDNDWSNVSVGATSGDGSVNTKGTLRVSATGEVATFPAYSSSGCSNATNRGEVQEMVQGLDPRSKKITSSSAAIRSINSSQGSRGVEILRVKTVLTRPLVPTKLTDHFPGVSAESRVIAMQDQFERLRAEAKSKLRRAKATRRRLQRTEVTIGVLTQNVNGLSKSEANVHAWFGHFRQRTDSGDTAIVFLQETHAEPEDLHKLTAMHSLHWGFTPDNTESPLSLWSPSVDRKGGVAILRNPHAAMSPLKPFLSDRWTEHWMAVTTIHQQTEWLLVNVYAPIPKSQREALFAELVGVLAQHDGPILVGGDFNCLLHPKVDRSNQHQAAAHGSPGLQKLTIECRLVDVLQREIDDTVDQRDAELFWAKEHTYRYTMPDGSLASSRLDRWYVTASHDDWVRFVQVSTPGPASDHDGVALRITSPVQATHMKHQRRVYPSPDYASDQTATCTDRFLDRVEEYLKALSGTEESVEKKAKAAAEWWDAAKKQLVRDYVEVQRTCRTKMHNSYRQRVRRLNDRLREADRYVAGAPRQTQTDAAVEQQGPTSPETLRVQLSSCKKAWQEAKADRLRRSHAQRPQKSTKDFYRRIATKYGDNTIYTLGRSVDGRHVTTKRLADMMAAGWAGVMQQPSCNKRDIDRYLDKIPTQPRHSSFQALADPMTPEEVAKAIKQWKRGKACGPDELGNDWYRNQQDRLVLVLTQFFNWWSAAAIVPASFLQANIHCIKKSKTAATPLEHRPIALLNTDYKVFTRIYSTRLKHYLSGLVHDMQSGFVPGRTISTPVDTLLTLQRTAASRPGEARGYALLLDFAKAYDSVSRRFLERVLSRYHFPTAFINVVSSLHADTSCRFLVNGYLSKPLNVTCGIRQGCPLAPQLFLLTIDQLYRDIDGDLMLRGQTLHARGKDIEVKISGYADDTALYVQDADGAARAIARLREFGEVSGLRVNLAKSIAVALDEGDDGVPPEIQGIPVLARGESCRYLGVQIGSQQARDTAWKLCFAALRTRLLLATAKTHTAIQRAEIARAIVVPKVLFLARYAWPTTSTVAELQQMVKIFVWGRRDGKPKKAWMGAVQAELPTTQGGVGVPNILTELLTLSAVTVARWASSANHFELALGDSAMKHANAGSTYITPTPSSAASRPRLLTSLWATGRQIVTDAHATSPDQVAVADIARVARLLSQAYNAAKWDQDQYSFTVDATTRANIARSEQQRRKDRGQFCWEWLRHCDVRQNGWLIDRKGGTYSLARSRLAGDWNELGQIVRWKWKQPGQVCFHYVPGIETATAPTARAFQRLCFALLYNFPKLLNRPREEEVLRPYDQTVEQHHEWHLLDSHHVQHHDALIAKAVHAARCSADLDNAATSDAGRKRLKFHPHPRYTRLVSVWGGAERWKCSRKKYRRHCAATREREGIAARETRLDRQTTRDDIATTNAMNEGRSALKWTSIARIPGLSAADRQLIFRIKAGSISAWNTRDASMACPHVSCTSVPVATIGHIFWDCPHAIALWKPLVDKWMELDVRFPAHPAVAVFGMRLPGIPKLPGEGNESDPASPEQIAAQTEHLFPMANLLWQTMCATAMSSVWRARTLLQVDDPWTNKLAPPAPPDIGLAITTTRINFLQRLARVYLPAEDSPALDTLVALGRAVTAQEPVTPTLTLAPEDAFLLFFDGSSRGNPGPGGAGSIIVRLRRGTTDQRLHWVSSMSYAHRSTTNNVAEYRGLLHGLQYAATHKLTPLHVVGDSNMIIQQFNRQIPPKKAALKRLYLQCVQACNQLRVLSWTHHYREHNKMADLAANIAMDTATSMQSTPAQRPTELAGILQHLPTDVGHWLNGSTGANTRSWLDITSDAKSFAELLHDSNG
ncbi:reverse transcriptase, partial [Globisporangium splendens]